MQCERHKYSLQSSRQGGCEGSLQDSGHLQKASALEKQPRLSDLLMDPGKAKLDEKIIESEVKMAVLCAHSNIPIAFHDK